MQTYSHFVLAAIVNRIHKKRQPDETAPANHTLPAFKSNVFLAGSILPDVPLILLTAVLIVVDLIQGRGGAGADQMSSVGYLFEVRFFEDPWVKLVHNLFHGPLLVLAYLGVGYVAHRRGLPWGATLFWFALSCALHTAWDIPVHHDDGPLLLFPFDMNLRFESPISYWDPNYFGRTVTIIEHSLLLGGLVWLGVQRWRERRAVR
jgi:hypothetical protein